ncbi:MAG: baseplate J/gp47 family protein [Proteobacteria bacterium]|nr:baseplate J/gp47 family protein [Pseudomonadota bacterium]
MRRDDPGPYSLDALKALPAPQLFTVDAQVWKARLVTWFEGETGRTLYPMQIEMLLIEALAYAMSVLGEEAQAVAEQHLVALAGIAGLERLGPNRSTPRLAASKARVTLRFSIPQARAEAVFISAGTRVGAGNGMFFTLAPCVIAIGALSADVTAEAEFSGLAGNGFLPGQLTSMLDPVAGVVVTNPTESSGGADAEDPELYRLRLANAYERISTGGSFAWYRETAIGVSAAIIDVAVVRPQPCVIDIYPLTLAGAAGIDLRNQVLATFNTAEALDIRFGDDVFVKPPVAVTGAPVLTIRGRGMASTIQADATAAAQAVLKVWRERLGAAVAPSDLEKAVKVLMGVIDAEVSGLAFQQLQRFEFFVATSLTVNIVVLP